jgi:hypothetical protein
MQGTAERYSYIAVIWRSVICLNAGQRMISNLLPSKGKGAQLLFGAPVQLGCSWSMSTPVRKIVKNSSSVCPSGLPEASGVRFREMQRTIGG